MDFRKAFKFPLKYDGMFYVWGANNTMVLEFDMDDNTSDTIRELIIRVLNEDKKLEESGIQVIADNLKFDSIEQEFTLNGKPFMCIRGWGHLTGIGGLNLDAEIAEQIQDDLAKYILEKLT